MKSVKHKLSIISLIRAVGWPGDLVVGRDLIIEFQSRFSLLETRNSTVLRNIQNNIFSDTELRDLMFDWGGDRGI